MKLTIPNALYIAGAILVGSAIISQFKEAKLITSAVLVIISMVILFLAYRKEQEKVICAVRSKKPWKIFGVTLAVAVIFFGLGFSIGKIIYQIIN